MPSFRCLTLIYWCACALVPQLAGAWSLTPRNALVINSSAVPGLAELSGLAYRGLLGGADHEWLAVQDSGHQLVTLSLGLAPDGALTSAAATATRTLSPGFDFEGIAMGPSGSVLVAEETTPAVRRYDLATGTATAVLPLPPVFTQHRANYSLESLTRSPGGTIYWTANEEALLPDGPLSSTTAGTMVRLQQFTYDSAGTFTLGAQYAYQVDPIHVGSTTDSRTRSGLVELVSLPDSTLLALERSLGITGFFLGVPIYQYESRIYHVTFSGATDTSQAPLNAGLAGQSYTPATKGLLWRGQAGGGFGQNLEGLALGPQLPGGGWSLVGVVDSGGSSDPLSSNTAIAFVLSPPANGDFNRDGAVDAADYVLWRKGLGAVYTTEHYGEWRAYFGQSVSGSSVAAPFPNAVPEPSAVLAVLTALPVMILWRRRSRGARLPGSLPS